MTEKKKGPGAAPEKAAETLNPTEELPTEGIEIMSRVSETTTDIRDLAVIVDSDLAAWQQKVREMHDQLAAPITSEDDSRYVRLVEDSYGRFRAGEYAPEELGELYFFHYHGKIPSLRMATPGWVVSTVQEVTDWPVISITLQGKSFGVDDQWAQIEQDISIAIDTGHIEQSEPHVITKADVLDVSDAIRFIDAMSEAVDTLREATR